MCGPSGPRVVLTFLHPSSFSSCFVARGCAAVLCCRPVQATPCPASLLMADVVLLASVWPITSVVCIIIFLSCFFDAGPSVAFWPPCGPMCLHDLLIGNGPCRVSLFLDPVWSQCGPCVFLLWVCLAAFSALLASKWPSRALFSLVFFWLLAAAWPFRLFCSFLVCFVVASCSVALLSPLCSSQCSSMMLCYAFLSLLLPHFPDHDVIASQSP